MATISTEFLEAIKNAKLYSKDDASELAQLSKELKFNKGKGYTNNHIRNFLLYQFTTTDEMVNMILNYYEEKKKAKQNVIDKQIAFTKKLQEEVA